MNDEIYLNHYTKIAIKVLLRYWFRFANLFVKEATEVVFSDIDKPSDKDAVHTVIDSVMEYKDNVLFVDCDVYIKESVKNMVTKTVGPIDILINNAMMKNIALE